MQAHSHTQIVHKLLVRCFVCHWISLSLQWHSWPVEATTHNDDVEQREDTLHHHGVL